MSNFLGANNDDFDFDRAASAFPDIEGIDDPVPSVAPTQTGANGGGFDFAGFSAAPSAPLARDVKITEADDFDKFESDFPELEPQASFAPPPVPAFQASISSNTPTFAPKPTQSAALSQPVLQHTEEEEEPEVIRQWREKQAEEIKKRDADSAAKREETLRKAERAIDQFYEEYNATKEKNIKANKESEAAFLEHLRDSLSEGTTWSRIAKYVDLENSQSKTLARAGPGTSDLTRYKDVLLRLKREGENAPGAAGY